MYFLLYRTAIGDMGLVDPGFLKEAIEAGGLFPVKTWEDNRIVAVWKL